MALPGRQIPAGKALGEELAMRVLDAQPLQWYQRWYLVKWYLGGVI